MTIQQAAECFGTSPEKLRHYESLGFFDCYRRSDGVIDYCDELLDSVGIINVLMEAGASPETLKTFLNRLSQRNLSKAEKLTYLRQQRQSLLDSIHAKQRSLDQLDYLIYEAMKS